MRCFRRLLAVLGVLLLAACANQAPSQQQAAHPVYKIGKPYEVGGNWYYPREDYSYDETGIASWYGQAFHGETTANGEIFNKNELTAAHKTLPLPTLARVTNLQNGRSIVVRINDRGPFSGARVIDVSQRAAQLLGFEQKGTAEVRVQVLADESKAIADAMRHYGTAGAPIAAASAGSEASENLEPPPEEVKTIEPVRTTPEIHQELLETKPVPEVVQYPVTPHSLYVQAGAFTVRENATKLKEKLASLGSVSVAEVIVNGAKFYRVRIGPLPTIARADAMLLRAKGKGVRGARTVVE